MRESFIEKRFSPEYAATIDQINAILDEYQAQGFTLTLRQLFYQFVARDIRPAGVGLEHNLNSQKTYTYIQTVLGEGRLAGRIDWAMIEDRTRTTQRWPTWVDPASIVSDSVRDYAEDLWADQPRRVVVWIEKMAVANLVEAACRDWQVPYFPVRGYSSKVAMYDTGKELGEIIDADAGEPIVLYLGDHDPSGLNMVDVARRDLSMYAGAVADIEVKPIALTMEQVLRYRPPPQRVKALDTRTPRYVAETGTEECWELDALGPAVIDELLRAEIASYVDMRKWRAAQRREAENRDTLERVAERWDDVVSRLDDDE
jgi:hypothetical protein